MVKGRSLSRGTDRDMAILAELARVGTETAGDEDAKMSWLLTGKDTPEVGE